VVRGSRDGRIAAQSLRRLRRNASAALGRLALRPFEHNSGR
jgi:hypothetical protein